ncbi:MAG: nitrogenase molybdenum-iron protein, alpha and beta chain [Oscillospiraceae bacterium]|jgi:nitrogenase molybdenum-iron protein beta chain|nr:nitrogenase molybdenum-iron protein, alpha and beta chain [Oscillospiraceae bacterium]
MQEFIEKSRSGCAFGAYYTALAIKNVLPIAHTGPGCIQQSKMFLGYKNGGQGPFTYPEPIIPCTNFTESDVVFGAVEKLKTTVRHALNNFKAELILIYAGCTPAIVGDDLDEAVGEFADAHIPVLAVETAGFKGSNIYGHHEVLKTLINKYVKPTNTINEKQVNVWGIIPFQDTFWDGTYDAIEKLLKSIGLEPNIIYGNRPGLENVRKIPSAKFNLTVSPWWDKEVVDLLETKFGTPSLVFPHIPVGVSDTTKFVRAVADFANLDKKLVESVINENEDRYWYYFNRATNWLFDSTICPKFFYTIGNSPLVTGITRYLVEELGLLPNRVYLTDDVPEKYQDALRAPLTDLEGGITAPVTFTSDGGLPQVKITKYTKEDITGYPAYVLGSYWDAPWAKDIGSPYLPISNPMGDKVVVTRSYFGYDGALTFFEDFHSVFEV